MSEFFTGINNPYYSSVFGRLSIPSAVNCECQPTVSGSEFIAGNGPPDCSIGNYGDTYLDIGNGSIYQKTITYLQPALRELPENITIIEVHVQSDFGTMLTLSGPPSDNITYILYANITIPSQLHVTKNGIKANLS